ARRQHQNGHTRPARAQIAANFKAILERQHHVQNDQIVVVDTRLMDGLLAVARHVHRIGLFAQPFGQHLSRVGFVLNQQDTHLTPRKLHDAYYSTGLPAYRSSGPLAEINGDKSGRRWPKLSLNDRSKLPFTPIREAAVSKIAEER